MKVLVTGANGLLGHHVVMKLQEMNHEIRLILRGERQLYFDRKNVEIFIGSFTVYEALLKAASGCDAIIHMAALTDMGLLHYEDYRKVNTDGAANVIRVADELNINRLVFVSTANTIGHGSPEKPADETSTMTFPFSESFYARSKAEAEKLFLKASEKPGKQVVIVHPTFMVGAYDTKPGSGKLLLMGYRKPLLFIPKGGKNFVRAENVAVAVCNALTMGRNGQKYLASGINLSFKGFYDLQKRVSGYRQFCILLPDLFLKIVGKAGDLLRKSGIKTEICSMNLNQLMVKEYYSNRKAGTELAMPPTNIEKAIHEAIDWMNRKFI